MKYCYECGTKTIKKECGIDGMIDYCPTCKKFLFPTFNSAVSLIVLSPNKDQILLIQQYGKKDNILVAGYINKRENAKEALIREIKEESGVNVKEYYYNDNEYYARTNTLIHNYAVVVDSIDLTINNEIGYACWYDISKVRETIKPNSLAKYFLDTYLNKM